MEKRKFNDGVHGYDMNEVVAVMTQRLENDGFDVEVEVKETRTPWNIGGGNVWVPHQVTIYVRDENIIPEIINEEVDYIGDSRYKAMKGNLHLDTDGIYAIVLEGERCKHSEAVRFIKVKGFLKNVITVSQMGEGRTLEQSSLVEMRTRSTKFADFRKFVNEKANNDYMEVLGLI